MSSRARKVEGQVQTFDWNAPQKATPAPARVEPPRGPRPPEGPAEDPQQRVATIERDAFAQGYAQGERAGAEVAAQRADAMLRRLVQTIEELASLRHEMIRRTEQQVVRLAMAIARRMLDRELAADLGLLLAMARVALDRLDEQASATIRLHPDDYAAIAAGRESVSVNPQVQVVADPVVGRGGCLVRSDFGLMDVGLDAQFGELAKTLLGERELTSSSDETYETAGVPSRV